MNDHHTDERERTEPAAVFSLLGNERRLEIIATLHDAGSLSFSDLRGRVGMRDSGQFNYHLSELVGSFVTKVDEEYALTAAGRRVARAVAAGLYTDSPTLDPFAIDGRCPACGERALEASYADERFTVGCRACGDGLLRVVAPPSLVRGRDPHEALEAFGEWSIRQVELALSDLCPTCGGPIESGVTERTPDDLPFDVLPRLRCERCGRRVVTSFAAVALEDPAVEAFLDHHVPDYDERFYWEFAQLTSDEHQELLSASPFRLQVTFTAPENACRVVIDDSLDVVETEVV